MFVILQLLILKQVQNMMSQIFNQWYSKEIRQFIIIRKVNIVLMIDYILL